MHITGKIPCCAITAESMLDTSPVAGFIAYQQQTRAQSSTRGDTTTQG